MGIKTAVVIKPDGTIPFDEGHDPEVRRNALEFLIDHGHVVEQVAGTKHLRIKGWVRGQKVERH